MNWTEISVRAEGEAAEAVSELFNSFGAATGGPGAAVVEIGGFDEVGDEHQLTVTVRTYLPADDPAALEQRRRIEEGLWHLGCIHPLGEMTVRDLAEEDWANAWKAGYKPLRIGRRFVVIPAWERDAASAYDGLLPIILDPGMAFGTGLHPSTQLCIEAMEEAVCPGMLLLDAGCGSGILSIAAARLGADRVDAFDIDPIAVRATRENAALNGVAGIIEAFESSGPVRDAPFAGATGRAWDVMLVNILPHVIRDLLDRGLHSRLAFGGRMILAGIIEAREPEMRDCLDAMGLRLFQRRQQGDWVSLVVG